jgi:predicted PurR-regulated permease PerM
LEKRGLGRSLSILVIYAVLGAAVYMLLFWLVPQFWRELKGLADFLPDYWHNLEAMLDGESRGISRSYFDLTPVKEHLRKTAVAWMTARAAGIIDSLDTLVALVFSPLLAYYVLRDWERLRDGFVSLWPVKSRPSLYDLGTEIDCLLLGFVKGHLSVCVIEGVITGIVILPNSGKKLFLYGVKNPLKKSLNIESIMLPPKKFSSVMPAFSAHSAQRWHSVFCPFMFAL